jgi:hypothetical protein
MEPGFKVENIGSKTFPGAIAKNFRIWQRVGSGSHTLQYEEEMIVPALNPGASTTIWWPPGATSVAGTAVMSCVLEPPAGNIIWVYGRSFEKDDKPARQPNANAAERTVIITQQNAAEQKKTNRYMLLLAILTFVQGVWGLDKVVYGVLHTVGDALAAIGRLLASLG